jgi:tetraacyldisaccharide 4'-kinase
LNPFSAIYGAAVRSRNGLYNRGILKARRLSGRVISVGNISVGGTGKTPFVILLGGLLQERGIPFDVLSRGYGRKTRGVLAVDPNGSPRDFGDEPILIAKRLGCPVIVGENRYQAGLFAERKFGPQVHILDDGFQHRSLARDFDIVLVAQEDVRDQMLPAGRLREPSSSLRRADAVVVAAESNYSAGGWDMQALDKQALDKQAIWRVRRRVSPPDTPSRPVAFCGIARPQQFIEQLRAAGADPVATKFYRDHHSYTQKDVLALTALRKQNRATGFVTTEKDAVNLGALLTALEPVAIARVVMELLEPADALDTILRVFQERRPSP